MLSADPYEWVWLLAIAVVVIGGTYLERWFSRKERPLARFLLSLVWTVASLAIGIWALVTGGRELVAVLGFSSAVAGAWRTAVLYSKRHG